MSIFGLSALIVLAILVALAFDFVNGFHDSANAIATVVATRVLSPVKALAMAAFFNFVGPFLFTLAVANTVGAGIVLPSIVTTSLILSALVGAILWDLVTWYWGLPTSSSHALVGGLLGAGFATAGLSGILLPTLTEWLGVLLFAGAGLLVGLGVGLLVWGASRARLPRWTFAPFTIVGGGVVLLARFDEFDTSIILGSSFELGVLCLVGATVGGLVWIATQRQMTRRDFAAFAATGGVVTVLVGSVSGALVLGGVTKVLLFMVLSPVLGFIAGFLVAVLVAWVARDKHPRRVGWWSRRLQLASSAFYSLTHGTNDAQKTMGIIGLLLFAAGATELESSGALHIPAWVIIVSAGAIGLGTLLGGWRIVHTVASRITHLVPHQGFAAETGGGVVLAAMAQAGVPVSTTHAITASIMGVGVTRRTSAVRWQVARRIVGAWIVTIPASALIAFVTQAVLAPILREQGVVPEWGLLVIAAVGAGMCVFALWRLRRARASAAESLAELSG